MDWVRCDKHTNETIFNSPAERWLKVSKCRELQLSYPNKWKGTNVFPIDFLFERKSSETIRTLPQDMTHVAIGLNKFWVILFWWFMVYVLNVNGVSCTGRAIFKHGERSVLHVTVIRTERTPVAQPNGTFVGELAVEWNSSGVQLFSPFSFICLSSPKHAFSQWNTSPRKQACPSHLSSVSYLIANRVCCDRLKEVGILAKESIE